MKHINKTMISIIRAAVLSLSAALLIPNGASAQTMRGDFDMDGTVTIGDVTELIDILLSGEQPQSLDVLDVADMDRDGNITIADVTELIDLLLKS